MNLSYLDQLQFIAWILALSQFILAFYVLLLDSKQTANRHMSALLLLTAIINFALGLMVVEAGTIRAVWPTYILAAAVHSLAPVAFLVTVALLKPDWLLKRPQLGWLVYGLALLPGLLTLVDAAFGAALWYTSPDLESFATEFIPLQAYTAGTLSPFIIAVNNYLLPLVTVILVLSVAVRTETGAGISRRIIWLLLGGQFVILMVGFGLQGRLSVPVTVLVTTTILVFVYLLATFQLSVSDRRLQAGRLQPRLTALILVIAVPVLIVVTSLVSARAGALLEQHGIEQLQATNRALASNVSVWLRLNIQALNQLVTLPDIISMDAVKQKPILERMDAAYPHLFLIHTTDPNGINLARNDSQENKDYSDRLWYQGARAGNPVTFQSLVSRTTGNPALNMAVPIRDDAGNIIGVGSIVSELDDLSEEVRVSRIGSSGFAYIVDEQNRVVAHPDPAFSTELKELTTYPPVAALREGAKGLVTFTDEQGQNWRAYVSELSNGWGVIVQQPEAELLAGIRQFQRISWAAMAIGSVILLVLAWLTIRQNIRPINILTETATAITAGDLSRVAHVEREDEFGVLADAFNNMTEQLRGSIHGLEDRIAARTERLEMIASLGERLGGILDMDKLLAVVVDQIKTDFGYYHVHIYTIGDAGENLVVAAGVGQAGAEMKAKGHHIPLNAETSLVARAARTARIVRIDNVREEEGWLSNPLLPDTYAEMAVPIIVEGQVIGVLDVQENEVAGLDDSDASLLRSVVSQVASAIYNITLLQKTEAALAEVESLNRQLTREVWRDIRDKVDTTGYVFTKTGIVADPAEWLPAMTEAVRHKDLTYDRDGAGVSSQSLNCMAVPLTLRGEVIGVIGIERAASPDNGQSPQGWSEDELVTVQTISEQVALALDSARLARETERAAWRDRIVSETTASVWSSADIEEVMKAAVAQLGDKLRASEVVIRLGTDVDLARTDT